MTISPLHNELNFEKIKPKTVWLESQYYEQAINISQNVDGEKNQWKAYLNELALLGFLEWLQQRIPDIKVKQELDFQQSRVNLQIGDFKVQLITVDNPYDNVIVPKVNITSPQLAAHLYVLIEVVEEAERIIIHGIIRHDEIISSKNSKHFATKQSDICEIPLSSFDYEISNLLLYIRFLEVKAIPLPTIKDKETDTITQVIVNIGQWLNGVFEEGWQSLGDLISETSPWGYARSSKSFKFPVKQGKLFNLGSLLDGKNFVLAIYVRLEESQERNVQVEIKYPNKNCLPQGLELKVTLNHDTPQSQSQSAIAREIDNSIMLEFSEPSNAHFKVEAIYQDAVFTEKFVL